MIGLTIAESSLTSRVIVRLFVLPSVSLKSNVIVYSPATVGVHVTDLAEEKSESVDVPPCALVTENL